MAHTFKETNSSEVGVGVVTSKGVCKWAFGLPVQYCRFEAGHEGKHSFEHEATELAEAPVSRTELLEILEQTGAIHVADQFRARWGL